MKRNARTTLIGRVGLSRCAVLGALAIGLVGLGCGGGENDSCRDHEECSGELYCAGPNDPNVCGIPPREGCAGDQDCDPASRCHAIPDACSPDGVGSECRPPCVAGECFEGFRCNADGACEAIPCDEGFACPAYQACDPSVPNGAGPVYNRTQGCITVPCQDDSVCPSDGACVNGSCQSGPGSCQMVQIVP